jgi:hypothetical protein
MRETPLKYRARKGMSLPRRLVPAVGKPLASTVPEAEPNDQNDNFQH